MDNLRRRSSGAKPAPTIDGIYLKNIRISLSGAAPNSVPLYVYFTTLQSRAYSFDITGTVSYDIYYRYSDGSKKLVSRYSSTYHKEETFSTTVKTLLLWTHGNVPVIEFSGNVPYRLNVSYGGYSTGDIACVTGLSIISGEYCISKNDSDGTTAARAFYVTLNPGTYLGNGNVTHDPNFAQVTLTKIDDTKCQASYTML